MEEHTKEMIFEAKSNAFAARSIFELFNEQMPEYIYKQPALNPMNQTGLIPGVTIKVNDQGSDEIARIAKIFNIMADSLDDAYSNLEHRTESSGNNLRIRTDITRIKNRSNTIN
ncbi:hypothetical protein [Trichormus azollae]|uniref:hypothetical protein n=1 Tax=Trichormus azollae TaxID=1164 RepID=UPI00325C638B